MKTIFLKSVLALVLTVSFAGCSDDDNATENGNANKFTFEGTTYRSSDAFYLNVGGDVTPVAVISLNHNDTASEENDTQVIFRFYGHTYDSIESGSYTLRDYLDPEFDSALHFDNASLYVGDGVFEDFTDGTLTIVKGNNSIKLTYSFFGGDGEVDGFYEGMIMSD